MRAHVRGFTPDLGRDLTLNQMLADLVNTDSAMSLAAKQLGSAEQSVHRMLVEAVRRLDPTRPQSFGQRSRLRQDTPWPGDAHGRSAKEIVGGPDRLALVIEFVDTLYNRVVVDSIGVAPATFSTSMALGEELELARAVAQDLALAASGTDRPPRDSDDPPEPLFELRMQPGMLGDAAVNREARRLHVNAGKALESLMEVRADGHVRSHPSPFWAGVDRLDRTVLEGDERQVSRALDSHLELVAKVLEGTTDLGLSARWQLQLALTGIGATAPSIASLTWRLPVLIGMAMTAVGAGVPIVAQQTTAVTRRLRGTRRRASAFNQFVGASATGNTGGAS